MAYFNGFPATYQQMYPQYQQQQAVQNAPQQSGIIWVQGEGGAKSYMVAPGQTVQLWDSENKVIYLKSADASGMPSMKVLDYTIRGEAEEKSEAEYATKGEVEALAGQVEKLRSEIAANKKKRIVVKEEEEDE